MDRGQHRKDGARESPADGSTSLFPILMAAVLCVVNGDTAESWEVLGPLTPHWTLRALSQSHHSQAPDGPKYFVGDPQ